MTPLCVVAEQVGADRLRQRGVVDDEREGIRRRARRFALRRRHIQPQVSASLVGGDMDAGNPGVFSASALSVGTRTHRGG